MEEVKNSPYFKPVAHENITELNGCFDINITVVDFIPENFNSLDALTAMVERLSMGK